MTSIKKNIKYTLLNLGCGQRYHKEWTNLDFSSDNKYVVSANLLNGIPFPDNSFDVVYHSHLLEHLPKGKAFTFIKECNRVLKPGGIIRIVVPDFENMVKEYIKVLNDLDSYSSIHTLEDANYNWIMLEILDQMVRTRTGGGMAEYLFQEQISNEDYIYSRVGNEMKELRERITGKNSSELKGIGWKSLFSPRQTILKVLEKIKKSIPITNYQVGRFRLSGEVHQWMYDKYSLKKLLKDAGFEKIGIVDSIKSNINSWGSYELDMKNGIIYKPNSLFIEAFKTEK